MPRWLAQRRKLIAFLATAAVVIVNRHFGADSEVALDVVLLLGGVSVWAVRNDPMPPTGS